MHAHDDPAETAIAHAVAEELRLGHEAQGRPPADARELGVPEFVQLCHLLGESSPDVLRRALDRVTYDDPATS